MLRLLTVALLASSATATFFTTSPVASTRWTAGESEEIRWQDDGDSPRIAAFGRTRIDLCTGTATRQACVTAIATIDGGRTTRLSTQIPPGAGPSGRYFIRYLSLNATDAEGVPLNAFSAVFTISGMTGPAPDLVDPSGLAYDAPGAGPARSTASGSASAQTASAHASASATSSRPSMIFNGATPVSSGIVNLAAVSSVPSSDASPVVRPMALVALVGGVAALWSYVL